MTSVATGSLPLLDFGVAAVPASNESACGDLHLVAQTEKGLLLAVVDGLGHGAEAARAARAAVETLKEYSRESVVRLIRLCHEKLKGTRGAVMSVASVNAAAGTLTWLGIGNVEGFLLNGQRQSILPRPGVVGHRLPTLRAAVQPISPGNLLVFFTDGIQWNSVGEFAADAPPGQIAQSLVSSFHREGDDALVLAARYRGRNEHLSR